MREPAGFRENIELLNDRFPDKEMLDVKDVMIFTGKSRNTVKRHIRFAPCGLISKSDLARQITA